MRKLSFVAVAVGVAVLLYYFYLPALLMMSAPKTDIGDGHFIILFPRHAEPIYRWHGVLTGALVAALGAIGLFVARDRCRSAWKPALRLGVGFLFLGALITQTGIQSYVAQLPDSLDAQFQIFRERNRVQGFGTGWPSQEEPSGNEIDYAKARRSVEVVFDPSARGEMSQASIQKTADRLYRDWRQACYQAALMDGATFNETGVQRPQRWTKFPIVAPETCRVYLRQQGNSTSADWCIRRDSRGVTMLYHYGPGSSAATSAPPRLPVRVGVGRRG